MSKWQNFHFLCPIPSTFDEKMYACRIWHAVFSLTLISFLTQNNNLETVRDQTNNICYYKTLTRWNGNAHTRTLTNMHNPISLLCWQLYWWKEYWEHSSVIHCPGRQISSRCQYPQLLTTATIRHSEHLSTPAVKHI